MEKNPHPPDFPNPCTSDHFTDDHGPIVRLRDSAVKEAKDRMEVCTEVLGYAYPTKKVVMNLSRSQNWV